jgi:hypothetical protein
MQGKSAIELETDSDRLIAIREHRVSGLCQAIVTTAECDHLAVSRSR